MPVKGEANERQQVNEWKKTKSCYCRVAAAIMWAAGMPWYLIPSSSTFSWMDFNERRKICNWIWNYDIGATDGIECCCCCCPWLSHEFRSSIAEMAMTNWFYSCILLLTFGTLSRSMETFGFHPISSISWHRFANASPASIHSLFHLFRCAQMAIAAWRFGHWHAKMKSIVCRTPTRLHVSW